jgi:hypothetical protein
MKPANHELPEQVVADRADEPRPQAYTGASTRCY